MFVYSSLVSPSCCDTHLSEGFYLNTVNKKARNTCFWSFAAPSTTNTTTRMHSSTMRIAHFRGRLSGTHTPPALTYISPCHICQPPAMHTPLPCTPLPHMPPAMHTPLPHMSPTMHTPLPCMPPLPHMSPTMHTPYHACSPGTHVRRHKCPLPHIPPVMYDPLLYTPPLPHMPSLCPCMAPFTMHLPVCHTCPNPFAIHSSPPTRGQTDTCKNITFAYFVCGR